MGKSTSIEWLEMPKFVWPVLLTCFLCYAWPIARMFGRAFRPEGFMVSTWYILGACFWFPWIFITANVALHCLPGLGALGAGINAWYVHGVILLFFVPVGVGCGLLLHSEDHRPAHRLRAACFSAGFWRSPSSAAGRACRNTWAARFLLG
jgi:cbb3-type cytochrome oxidase subunit 1